MIVDRILQLIEYKKISKNRFYQDTGLSNGFLDKVKDIGSSKIEQILNTYPELNVTWLIMGTGEMILSKENSSSKSATDSENNLHITAETSVGYIKNEKALGLPKVITLRDNDREAITLVPAKASAGYLNGFADPEYIEHLPSIYLPNIGSGTHRGFEIKGHSMDPTLHNSSIAIGRWVENIDEIRDRRIYIIVTKSEGIVIKRVLNRVDESGRLILISDNQNKREYPNILLDPDDILEIWYLRAKIGFEFPEPDMINNRVNDLEAKYTILEDKLSFLIKQQL